MLLITMKRTPLYIALTAATLFASCTKQLDQFPSTSLPDDEAIESVASLHRAVNGAYSPLVLRYGYGGDVALYPDAKGGDVRVVNPGYQQTTDAHHFTTRRNSAFSEGAYRQFAFVIGRVNNVLKYAPAVLKGLQAGSTDEQKAKDDIAQLYALRALAHLELARLYCYIPTSGVNTTAQYSGVPLNLVSDDTPRTFQRSTLKETYEQIFADFLKALEGNALSSAKTSGSGHINSWTVKALLSRAYLYYGDYQKAYDYAEDVIANSPYALYSREEYPKVWNTQGASESLFEVLTTDKSNAGLNSLGSYTNPSGYAEYAVSDDFLAWLRANRSDDIRFTAAISERQGGDGTNKAYYTLKYPGLQGSTAPIAVNNYKVIRLSEVYLIAAEALLKGATSSTGKTAVSYYNTLRKNRISGYTPASSVTLQDLLDERRVELFCEGHRLYDLVRNKINVKSSYIANPNKEYDYLNPALITELPQREKNLSPELVLEAAK